MGGFLCGRTKQTDFFIAADDANRKELLKSFKESFDGEILAYQEFIDLK